MNSVEVRFGEWIQEGFNLYKANMGVLIVASLIAVLLSALTLGILAGPMMAGMIYIGLAIYDKRPVQAGDVFKGFGYFLNSFLLVLVWGLIMIVASIVLNIIPILGQAASLCVSLALPALLMFSIFLIVEKGAAFWPASMESINMVKTNFWPFLGFGIVAGIIGSIGSILCGIGVILTVPLQVCMVTVAYREVFGGASAASPPPLSSEEL